MATQIQFRRGSAAEHTAFTGALGEITVNTTNDSLHVHDASTAGGYEQARADLSNHSNVGILTAVTFSGNLEGTVSGSIVGNINSSGVSTFFSINSENISNTGIVTVSQDLYVDRNLKVAGVSTFFSINSENISNTGIVTVSQDLYVDRNLKVKCNI
jgi:hypothetical protein